MGKWTRRVFITAGSLLGGGLVLGVGGVVFAPNRFGIVPPSDGNSSVLTTWIKITPDNQVIAVIPHCEMGQGAQTGLAMMLAEELEADWNQLTIEEAPAQNIYTNGHLIAGFISEAVAVPPWLQRALQYASYKVSDLAGLQITGGSSSTYTTGQYGMRIAGAAAKAMLLEAAAGLWQVAVTEVRAENSRVLHAASNRSASYGELAAMAATLQPPVHPVLKSRESYSIVGSYRPRPDIPSKVDGSAHYGIDITLPNMFYAAVAAAPVQGSTLQAVDAASKASVMAMPGIKQVVELDNAVVVVASGYWQASQAIKALKTTFTLPPEFVSSTDELYRQHAAVLDSGEGKQDLLLGEGAAALETASTVVTAEYRVPTLAHATMEPMSATAQFVDDHCTLWAGTQDPLSARGAAAKALAIDTEQVTFFNAHSGGGFGRRLPGSFDYVEQAALIAKAMSPTPVKLIWSREEDMQHDYYRQATLARFSGGLNADNMPDTWVCDYTAPGEMGASHPIYAIPNQQIHTYDAPGHLRIGSWRSVAYSQQGFFMESFIDELAAAAGKNPLDFRLALLAAKPRHQAVLQKVAAMADWHSPLPAGSGRGIAIVEAFSTIIAEVAEVSVDADGTIKVHQLYAAVDCGLVVNPDQAKAQIEGGMLFGLSTALYHEIQLEAGAVSTRSFTDYPMVQLATAPRVHVEFIESTANMGGLGEPGVPPVAPAVANAVFAATGKRLRTLPLQAVN